MILDVRERLELPRIRFRSAVADATRELANEEPRHLDAAIADLRKRVVAPAIVEIQEELGALNVRSTLLRVTSNPLAAGTLAAQLSLAAGAGGTGGVAALARGLLAAPIVAAMAKEADYRSTQKRALRLRPYWMLHEAGVELRKRVCHRVQFETAGFRGEFYYTDGVELCVGDRFGSMTPGEADICGCVHCDDLAVEAARAPRPRLVRLRDLPASPVQERRERVWWRNAFD